MNKIAHDAFTDESEVARRIHAILAGPVVRALREMVPEIRGLSDQAAYGRIMDDVHLLHHCIETFRRHPDRFRHLLVDAHGRRVTSAHAPLACGPSLRQVIALVVRTAARRHFRRTEAEPPPRGRLLGLFAGGTRERGAGADEAYRMLRPYLAHPWQLPLLPAYAALTPAQRIALGPRLLELDTPAKLRRAVSPPSRQDAKGGEVPLPSGRPHANDLVKALELPAVVAALPRRMSKDEAARILGSVGPEVGRFQHAHPDLRLDQLAVLLLTAHGVLGHQRFQQMFGPAHQASADFLTGQIRAAGLSVASSLGDVTAFAKKYFRRRHRGERRK